MIHLSVPLRALHRAGVQEVRGSEGKEDGVESDSLEMGKQ